jgi:Na+/melibiose symporter-like transporter
VRAEPADRLTWRRLALYALPAAPIEAMFWLVVLYQLKFATDVIGVSPAVLGAIFGAVRLWDAFLDPVAGWLSDRTRSRMGRRRPWLVASAIPVGVAFAAAWSPPLGSGAASIWLALSLLAFYTAHTAFGIPHTSLGAELATSHHERTRVFGVRGAFQGAGIFAGLGALHALEHADDPRRIATAIGVALGAIATGCILVTALRLREPRDGSGRGGGAPWTALRDVIANPHARRLLGVFFCGELAVGLLATALPFASAHLLGAPGGTSLHLLAYLAPSLAALPAWPALSRRYGKARTWRWAKGAAALGFGALWFADAGAPGTTLLLCAAIGVCHGASRVLPYSIQADVIDWDELRTGERKEGIYCATWNLAAKAASGLAVALCGGALAAAGIAARSAPTPAALETIRVLVSLAPAGLTAVAAALLAGFRLGEREHAAIRAAIDARGGPIPHPGPLVRL